MYGLMVEGVEGIQSQHFRHRKNVFSIIFFSFWTYLSGVAQLHKESIRRLTPHVLHIPDRPLLLLLLEN